ncbi:hypothetical protein BB559_004571 [Furculomyces boomerangus]|uniref:ACT domain-containing protein n=1 Tax=Furculomyces boomerangus TaxID=61424 RepID=A0A2T9YDX0_9FUNG|nr:hypothetical protein BB559_004571 [Furculomyces boomerangus]
MIFHQTLRRFGSKAIFKNALQTKRNFAAFRPNRNMDDSALYQTNVEDKISALVQKTSNKQKNIESEYVLNCFMQDEPGILARCTGIMAGRGYNIDSLVVSKTEVLGLSRMTLTLKGERKQIIQAQKQLEDLNQVWAVVNLTESRVIEREILLIKVSLIGPSFDIETRDKQSVAMKHKLTIESNRRLGYLKELSSMCKANIVDVGAEAAIVQLCAKSELVDVFIKLVEPFGIFELARSGRMVMSASAKISFFEDEENEQVASEEIPEDLSNLPPS